MCVRFKCNKYAGGLTVTYRRWMVFNILKCMIFARTMQKSLKLKKKPHCMNQWMIKNGWVADIFYKDFVLRDCAIIIIRRRPVVKRKGRFPLLIPYSHQLNVFN